jgi:nifR3 family TIM-barrel protein
VKKRMNRVVAQRGAAGPVGDGGAWPLAEPFRIGDVTISNRVIQAPLAGIANWAFRRQSRRHGAGLAVSEMVSSYGIVHGNRRTQDMIRTDRDPEPVAFQLFGSDPAVMADAARALQDAGADIVDINMGCPVRKVCKTGAGAALLLDPEQGAAIVEAMVRAVDIPITVKMRRGMTPATADPVTAAKRFEAAGASALFVHPRTAAEEYAGRADHRYTAEVAEAVTIPVIASGDIDSPAEAKRVMEEAGVAAVAIGRPGLGNPWIYGEVAGGHNRPEPTLDEILAEVESFAEDVAEAIGHDRACAYMRKFYPWYLAAGALAGADKDAVLTAPTLDEALERLRGLVERHGLKPAA